jgi:hypothetical protein
VTDAISFHPYDYSSSTEGFGDPTVERPPSLTKVSFASGIPAMHQVMVANGDSDPMWLTEFGFANCPAAGVCVPTDTQARYVASSLQKAATFNYVKVVLLFRLRDWYPSGRNLGYGLLNQDWSPKPAYAAAQSALASLPH